MSELRESLQRATDDAAAPIELDEITRRAPIGAQGWQRRRNRRPLVAVAMAAAVFVLIVAGVWTASDRPDHVIAGPTRSGPSTVDLSAEHAPEELQEFMILRGASVSRATGYETLGQLAAGTAPTSSIDDLELVVGRVTAVDGLRGYYPGKGDDEVNTYDVDFDDPRAMWRSVVLTVSVDETLVGDLSGTVRVGFVVDPKMDLETVRRAWLSFGRVVMPLSPSVVFESTPGVLSIESDGEMLVSVDSDGQLAMPFLTAESARTVLADAPTIDDLRAQASKRPGN